MELYETLSIMIVLVYSVRTSIIILISVRLPEAEIIDADTKLTTMDTTALKIVLFIISVICSCRIQDQP